jgi:hypothetical protein
MIKNKINFLIFFLFIFGLFIGLNIYKDYGISLDEYNYRSQGYVILNHIGDILFPEIKNSVKNYRSYISVSELQKLEPISGVPFHMSLSAFEVFYNFKNKEDFFIFKHLITFLIFFIGTLFFYYLLEFQFKNKILSLMGVIFLFLSPRIFSDSFYNPNDIVFMSLIIILCYFSIKYLSKLKIKYLIILSLFTSVAISTRPMAIYVPLLVVSFLFIKFFFKKITLSTFINNFFLFFFFTIICTYIFSPTLWLDPINNFIYSLKSAVQAKGEGAKILYMSKFTKSSNLPWHYLIVWIFITTPLLYIILFLLGVFRIFKNFRIKELCRIINNNYELNNIFIFLIFLIPLFTASIFSRVMFNGWRHLYFIYPAIVFIAIIGLNYVFNYLFNKNFYMKFILYLLVVISIIQISVWMIKNHPHQMVYFNHLAGNDVGNKFEIDYWGLSNRTAIEHIAKNDLRNIIKIAGESNTRLQYTFYILNDSIKKRFKIVNYKEADYIISVYNDETRRKDLLKKGLKIFNEIRVDDIIINSTFKK